jgi:hypothetical protein
MFIACTRVGDFKFVGLAHDTAGKMLQWTATQGWVAGPAFVFGRGVFDNSGIFRDTVPAGYQFLNDSGVPVTRIDTYGPKNGLSEWSETGGLQIGQGHADGGVLVWDGANLRVLDTGYCIFIRVHRVGEFVAISYAKSGVGAVIVQTTLTELRALPIVGTTAPNPGTPPVVPPVTPKPEPPPVTLIAPDGIEAVRAAMRAHPEINPLDDAQRGRIIDFAAAALNAPLPKDVWGRKSRNSQGTDLNTDGLTYMRPDGLFEIYDAISGGDGSATWDGFGPFRMGENGYWVPAVPVVSAPPGPGSATPPVPTPEPVPETTPPDLDVIGNILAGMLTVVQALDAVTKRLDALRDDAAANSVLIVAIDAQLKRGFKSRYLGDINPR